jgi:hypothetical protein
MTERAAIPDHDDPAAWAQAALRRQVERLDALAELGLDMARAIAAEKPDAAVTAFARVAKVVRLCGLLQARLIKDMEDACRRAKLLAPEREAKARIAAIQADPAHDHKARVERIVERQVRARHNGDEEEIERLMLEACDRLDDDDIYRDVMTRPVGELVGLICKDLGVEPDWERLSQEAWAQEEIGVEGSPFYGMHQTRPPPRAGEVARRDGGGIPPPLPWDRECEPRTSRSSAPDG